MAICIYPGEARDVTGNGLGILRPTRCTVRQEAGGLYELEITHPITGDNRWTLIKEGRLIKAPTPTAETPHLEIYHEGTENGSGVSERIIWRVRITTAHANGYSRIYQRASTGSRVLKRLRNGTEYEYLGPVGSNWHKAVSADGVSGYMYTANSEYVRTEEEVKPQPESPGWSTVVKPRQVREQLFRITEVRVDTTKMEVKAAASHVSYDLLKNVVTAYKAEETLPATVLKGMQEKLVAPYEGDFYTDITEPVTVEWQMVNGIAALLDPDNGFLHKAASQGRLVRDNWDWFFLSPKEVNRGLSLRYGKNLLGVQQETSSAETVTRLVPYGEDKEGNMLMLPEAYVDADNAGEFPIVLAAAMEVQEAKEKDASGEEKKRTKEDCYVLLREAAQKAFQDGTNALEITMTVDFLHLGDTVEYADYKDLQQAFLYDTVTLWESRVGIEYRAQVIAYEFDCILERYQGMTLGRLGQPERASVASWQLPNGGIAGTKLSLGSVIGNRLRDLSVTNAKLGNASISYAKIEQACITLLNADAVKAAVAEIQKVTAGEITTNELYAQIVEAVALEVNKVTSGEITTNDLYAQIIKAFVLEIGKVTSGEIFTNELFSQLIQAVTAEFSRVDAETVATNALYTGLVSAIQADLGRVTADSVEASTLYGALVAATDIWAKTATFDIANIENSFTGNAVVQMGTAGKFYMSDLMVNDGNMVNLSAGNLMVKGEDGSWYQIIVSDDGVSATRAPVVVENQNVTDDSLSGEKIVENSINVSKLSADSLQANEAFLVSLVAGLAKFGSLTANEAMVQQLNTALIKANDALRIVIEQGPGMLEGLSKYFTFSDGLQISAEGSNFTSKWDEKQLGFYQSGKLVAYISNNALNADRLRANVSSEVGSWMWVSEDPQNLTLKWTGVT